MNDAQGNIKEHHSTFYSGSVETMAAAMRDSTVEFGERAKKLKLPAEALQVLSGAGIGSFGRLCFSVSSSPLSVDVVLVVRWMKRIFAHHPFDEGTRQRVVSYSSVRVAGSHDSGFQAKVGAAGCPNS